MSHPQTTTLALAACALLLLTACGGATEESPPAGDEVEQPLPGDEEDGATDGGATDDGLRDEVDLAIADAADERGITEEEIEVIRAEEVEWPDGALGCPEEGEMYTQAIVPGYLVVLEVDGEEIFYHGAQGEPPFHCEDPQSPTQE
jgi:hypothetical protein